MPCETAGEAFTMPPVDVDFQMGAQTVPEQAVANANSRPVC